MVKITSGAPLNNMHLTLLLVHGMSEVYCAGSVFALTGITLLVHQRYFESTECFVLMCNTDLTYLSNNQLNALFICSLLGYHTHLFICSLLGYHTHFCAFQAYQCPSSGGNIYICGKWWLLYFRVDCKQAWPGLLSVKWHGEVCKHDKLKTNCS
jgi:hypothetical protein